ncbi:hypothetical protein C6495_10940 [Candidatus Poribacteria bacterium]|nr:MAG: hypothetical protein C6495_10940 [Candidatus Poribacteria bacterium]
MNKSKENTITNAVAPLLRAKLTGSGYTVAAHPTAFDGSAKEIDICVRRRGYETIGIEAKVHGSADDAGVNQLQTEYFGKQLNTNWRGSSLTLQTGMAIRYPEEASTCPQAELATVLSESTDFEYRLVTADSTGDFPKNGFVRGSLDDIATALTIGAVPAEKIQAAINIMTRGMDVAVNDITQAIAREAECLSDSAIAENMGLLLEERVTEKTLNEVCSKASLFIMNAFIFQFDLAGKKGFEKVRSLNDYDTIRMNYKKVSADWIRILNVNYVPIFKPAARIILMLHKYNRILCQDVLKTLWQTARTIVENHREAMHQIVGEVFQEVLADRRYVKANYTLPESAALLSALVCPDIDVNNLPKVADYACGTGALLNGVYQQVRRLYSRKSGKSDKDIHRSMLEENLAGVDIYPHATHVTFTVMASAHPQVTLGSTRVLPAPFGKKEEGIYQIGSLELLDNQMLFGGSGEETVRLWGKEFGEGIVEKTVTLKREFPDGEMDIVIMNPPFLKPGADPASNNPKNVFEAAGRSKEEKKAMQDALRKKDTRVAHGQVAYSYFVELADKKLRKGGRMGMILPATVLTSGPFKKVREMWATEYHDVVVVTIAQRGGHDSAFSHDTNMAECMVVATKGIGKNTGRAKFVSLSERPKSLLAGQTLAVLIQRHAVTRRLEDEAHGGERLMIGDVNVGQMLECPIDAGEWGASRVKSMSLMQIAYQMRHGTLRLPQLLEAIDIPICLLGEIGQVGASHRDIKDKDKRGAFEMHRRESSVQEGYDALWKQEYITPQRSMQVVPDHKAQIKPDNVEKAHGILRQHNSRTHYHQYLGFNANSVLAHWTENPSIGVNLITNVKLDKRYDAAWTLWTNSTFGMLCHWATAGKQQPGRGILSLNTLQNVPTLDVRKLTDAQLKAADNIFTDLKKARMLPYNECASDIWRHILDARLLAEVLGITDVETHRAMQRLREMLSEEPSIAGTTETPCSFARDKKDAAARSVPYDYDDALEEQALKTQQLQLASVGTWLPALELPL